MKPLLFELPAQTHPAPGHQLHLRHVGDNSGDLKDVDQGDDLGEEDVADQNYDFCITMVILARKMLMKVMILGKKILMLITSFLTAATMVTTKQAITTSCFIVN